MRLDSTPASDPVDNLANHLHQITFLKEDLIEKARQCLAAKRAFPIAHYSKTGAAAATLKDYMISPGHSDSNTAKSRRLKNAVALFTNHENQRLENSRILVTIFKQTLHLLHSSNKQLANSFSSEIIEKWAVATYTRLWDEATHKSSNLEQDELSRLCFISAFLADLHAEDLLGFPRFCQLAQFALPLIHCHKLFNIFLFHFLSRSLTGSGVKLEPNDWHHISMKWDSLKAFDKSGDLSGAVIRILHKTAMGEERGCAVGWSYSPSNAGDRFCEEFTNKVILRSLEDEDEDKMAEDNLLADALFRVGLGCDMDFISESLQSFSMN